jgi:lysyl-tRNA synthetase, class II
MNGGEQLRSERLKKLEILKASGMDAYPAHSNRTLSIKDFLLSFEKEIEKQHEETLTGRVMSLRKQGGIIFGDLFDGTGRIQIVLQKTDVDEAIFNLFDQSIDQSDFIECVGIAYLTKRGEKSLKCISWRMLTKSLSPLPSEWFGLKDEELRLRQRYLDILLNPEVRAMLERRSKFWQTIRTFLMERGFLEVETPILENSPGGAEARPFITHHNALDMEVYLRISAGELWQKRLLIAGFPKVFEIGRIFRNEGQSREHLQDYTQVETYEAYSDMRAGMQFMQDFYRRIAQDVYGRSTFSINDHEIDLNDAWEEIDFCKKIEDRFGINPITCSEKDALDAAEKAGIKLEISGNKARAIDQLWKQIRKTVSGPAFLTGVPVYLEPLAKRSNNNPNIVERVQFVLAGSEMGKGFSELNDPQDQERRFREQQALRDAGDDEAQRLDDEYIRAMEYGMPPAFGFGVSERLFAFLENRPIHEVQIFPLLRPRQ